MWVKSCCCCRAEEESVEVAVAAELVVEVERWDRRRSWLGLLLAEDDGEERWLLQGLPRMLLLRGLLLDALEETLGAEK